MQTRGILAKPWTASFRDKIARAGAPAPHEHHIHFHRSLQASLPPLVLPKKFLNGASTVDISESECSRDAVVETLVRQYSRRIAWRIAVDRSRQRGRQKEIPLDDPDQPLPEVASSHTSADQTVQGCQVSAALERMIAALPEKLRQPLILSTIEEMSPREVAATLGIETVVRSRVFRARQILKEPNSKRQFQLEVTVTKLR